MKNVIAMMVLSLMFACSSSKVEKSVEDVDNSETIKKDYVIRDASSNLRPGWTVDAAEWAKVRSEADKTIDLNTYRYFSFETEPKNSREMACNLAKANARADIAGEITAFIQKTLGETTEGQAAIDPNNPITAPLRSYVENNLVEKIQAIITGAAVEKTYWEFRQFEKALGAKRDYKAFTCAVLVKVKNEFIEQAIDQVKIDMMNRASSTELKAKVEKVMDKADEDFEKLRGI